MSQRTEAAQTFRASFNQATWPRLLALGTPVRLALGSYLLRRGDSPGGLYVLLEGELEVLDPRTTPPIVLSVIRPGDVLAEISFMAGTPATADVRASTQTSCVLLDRTSLIGALQADPALDAALHRALAVMLAQRLARLTTAAAAGVFASIPTGLSADEHDGPAEEDAYLAALLRDRVPQPIALGPAARVTLGRSERCDIVLDDPRVAWVHAQVFDDPDIGLHVTGVAGEAVRVDGLLTLTGPLREGQVLSLGRSRLRVRDGRLEPLPRPPRFTLRVEGIYRRIGAKVLLHDVSFTALSGEVIALVGPSGAGKSTLLKVLSGQVAPEAGEVLLGGEPLADVVHRRPSTVAEVPQDDIVLPELTVRESLEFAARLRNAGDDPRAITDRLIPALQLDDAHDSRIGDPERRGVSGGQRKRVNIGTELVSPDTRVLLLDEPTSGLDPRSALDLTRLARGLADEGRVVLVVTHDLDPVLLAEVDHLLVLGRGGRLAWFGPVDAACASFGVEVPSLIFDRLPDRPPEAWAARYARSSMADALRERHAKAGLLDASQPMGSTPADRTSRRVSWPAQVAVLARRVALVKRRDPTSLFVLVLQPALVGLVMLLVFSNGTAALLFLLVLSCYWFGMSASVRELIADRMLWMRERHIGISPSAWVVAKALVIGAVVAVQAATLSIVAHVGIGLGALGFSLPALVGTAVLTGWVGVGTGLLISALVRRSEAAVGAIVLWLVPQITFSGLLMPLTEVSIVAWALSWLTPVRYALHLALQTGTELQYLKLGTWHTRPVSGELYWMGLRPAAEGSLGMPAPLIVAVLAGLVVCQVSTSIWLMGRR